MIADCFVPWSWAPGCQAGTGCRGPTREWLDWPLQDKQAFPSGTLHMTEDHCFQQMFTETHFGLNSISDWLAVVLSPTARGHCSAQFTGFIGRLHLCPPFLDCHHLSGPEVDRASWTVWASWPFGFLESQGQHFILLWETNKQIQTNQ